MRKEDLESMNRYLFTDLKSELTWRRIDESRLIDKEWRIYNNRDYHYIM